MSGTVAGDLMVGSQVEWSRLAEHPFVHQAGDGSLRRAVFDRWLVADHFFVVGFRRFLTGLVALAPDEHAADVLAAGLPALQAELDLFRREAATRGLDLDAEPGPVALGYTAFLRASLQDGYAVALAVLYGAEKAYFDAWSAVRAGGEPGQRLLVVRGQLVLAGVRRLGRLAGRAARRRRARRSDRADAAGVRPGGPVRAVVLERGAHRRLLVMR